jgi:hypothetical protein
MLTRVGLWFGSVLVSIAVFSLVWSIVFNSGGALILSGGALILVFRVTSMFALPVACLYLPVVLLLKDAEERRGRFLFLSATLVGPAADVLLCLLLQLRGGNVERIWKGDPLIGLGGIMVGFYALFVGFLTACCYDAALKLTYRPSPRVSDAFQTERTGE